MRVLALDTSTEFLSLAVFADGALSLRDVHAGQRHSELTLPLLDDLLKDTGFSLHDFDGIAFGEGPGSFTGVRIACGIAQGLAFGAELPVIGISTLLALAAQSEADSVMACLDARMGEVYFAAYKRDGDAWHTVSEAGLYAPHHLPAIEGDAWVGLGNGFKIADGAVAAHYAAQLRGVYDDKLPHAREIAIIGERAFAAGKGMPAWEAAPLYVRDKVALKTCER